MALPMYLRMARRPPGVPPFLRQTARERLDHLDHRGDLALVARKNDAFGERIRDDDHMLRRDGAQLNWTAGQDLLVFIGHDLDDGGLVLTRLDGADDARLQPADDLVLLQH
jgi:hypothetical protein